MPTQLDSDPCRKLVVAIHESNIRDCLDNVHDLFNSCQTFQVQVAYYWLKLLLSEYYNRHRLGSSCIHLDSSYSFIIKLYTNSNRTHLFNDLKSGKVDIYPFEVVVTNEAVADNYYLTSPLAIQRYSFYMNLNGTDSNSNMSPVTFLTSPFSTNAWICTMIAICIGFSLNSLVRRVYNRLSIQPEISISKRIIYALIFVPLASLIAPYCSSLKALVMQPTISQPFTSLADLAPLIRSGQMQILIENQYSRRWRMLVEADFTRSASLHLVYEAIKAKEASLLLTSNMTEVCSLMEANPKKYLYFGYDDILYTTCKRMCFWKYTLMEDGETMSAFVLGKHATAITRLADTLSHAVPNYQRMEMNKRYSAQCGKTPTEAIFIDGISLRTAFIFLGIGCGAAMVLVLIEIARSYLEKWNNRRGKIKISFDTEPRRKSGLSVYSI